MDKFCFVSIMLFAIQRDMINCSIIDVTNEIDHERDILSRCDKYFDNEQVLERIWPL